MTSSILAGDRRWGTSRRNGKTVLGKVVVPKPLNLPSQRLENHGLDPNVDIVPKGSLSWGTRSSSSASNPWGPSGLSPKADGATVSPSHLSGRPSSGGSGTRPSTADSGRIHEPNTGAWGPNSRPSSASGALTSSTTSLTSLRPHSAETRPSSSQLSRFAEPLPDNSATFNPTGIVEKLVVTSSKNDGFSLSSGDFPTLGSEKDNSGKNIESQDLGSHGRPSSSSGRGAHAKESTIPSQEVNSGTVNSWKRDSNQHVEDGFHPRAEKWQAPPQQYLNTNVPPHHFDAWHGPHINAPAGVWYRGPPGGPPYPPVAPGGFPMEPFPYYHPQFPPPPLANSQQVPLPGVGPRGCHPRNGVLYRPQIPDAYIHPGMPIRAGFYPGPVAYEGYYGPPMGYCNSNERDIPFMGMAAGPSIRNRYSAQNPHEFHDPHPGTSGRGSAVKTLVSGPVESGPSDETQGPSKVIMKQHNEWDGKEEENGESAGSVNASYFEKGNQPRTSMQNNEWGEDKRRDAEMYSRRPELSENYGNRGSSSDSVIVESPKSIMVKSKAVDDSSGKKPEIAEPSFPDVPRVLPDNSKDSTLIHKIKGLNAKSRVPDGRHDVAHPSSREEQNYMLRVVNANANNSTNEVGTPDVCVEIPAPHDFGVSTVGTTLQLTAAGGAPVLRHHGGQGSVNHGGKARSNNRDADGRPTKPCSFTTQDRHTSVEAVEKSEIDLPGRGVSLTPVLDPSDSHAQRAKMRELAKQRAIQLQKEEEERIRQQKAKALAKLEELNRRTQAMESSIQKLEKAPPSGATPQEHESWIVDEPAKVDTKIEAPCPVLVSNRNVVDQTSDSSTCAVRESNVLSRDLHLKAPNKTQQEPVVSHSQLLPLELDVLTAGAVDEKASPQVNEDSVFNHKRMGYKQKKNTQVEKNLTKKLIPVSTTETVKSHHGVVVDEIEPAEVVTGEVGSRCKPILPASSNVMPESLAHQRRKNNRSGKNKQKLDDTSYPAAFPSLVPKETNPTKVLPDKGKPKTSQVELRPSSVKSVTDVKHVTEPSEQHCSLPTEEARGRVHNLSKSQQPHRMPRNPQAYKSADKSHGSEAVIWAPVTPQNKVEVADESSQKNEPDAVIKTAKSDNFVHNGLKIKRAEMERYVPKPAAKVLSQLGSVQEPTPSQEAQHTESSRPVSPSIGKVGTTVGSINGDNKQNKQAKAHGGWRQRGSTDLPGVKGIMQQGSSSISNPSNNVQKYVDQHELLQAGINSVKVEPRVSDEWSDGWNIPDYSTVAAAAPVTYDVKDQGGVTGKGNQHPYKGPRNMRNNHDVDQRKIHSGETDMSYVQPLAPEISQIDRVLTSKENRSVGEQKTSSHWQPKSQANDHKGNRSSADQIVTAGVGKVIRKDAPPQARVQIPPPQQQHKESSEIIPQLHTVSENKDVGQTPNIGREEAKRERKVASSKGYPHSNELAPPAGMDSQIELRLSSGSRKNGSEINRPVRGQDNKQKINRERQGQNSHFEYQPVGSFNNSKPNKFEGPIEGSRSRERGQGQGNDGSCYREKGQGSSRRGGGNFYGRQSGTVQVDAGYDGWE